MVFERNNSSSDRRTIKNYVIISINLSGKLSLNVVVDGLNYNVTFYLFAIFKLFRDLLKCKIESMTWTFEQDIKTVRNVERFF